MRVSVPEHLLGRMMAHAQDHPGMEVIGFLLGNVSNDTVSVTETATGQFVSKSTTASFVQEAMARIFQDVLDGKYGDKGRIIGWYHSHPGFGLFLSQTDIDTHSRLLQFDPRIVALVVEPTTEEIGAFTVSNGGVIQLEINSGGIPAGPATGPESFTQPGMSQAVRGGPGQGQVRGAGLSPLGQVGILVAAVLAGALISGAAGFMLGKNNNNEAAGKTGSGTPHIELVRNGEAIAAGAGGLVSLGDRDNLEVNFFRGNLDAGCQVQIETRDAKGNTSSSSSRNLSADMVSFPRDSLNATKAGDYRFAWSVRNCPAGGATVPEQSSQPDSEAKSNRGNG